MIPTLQPYLLWLIAGFVLIIVELLSQSFTILFFGIAALIVGVLKVLGLSNLTLELFIFAILGLAGLILFRKKIVNGMSKGPEMKNDTHQIIILSTDIPPKSEAIINYQGTTWTAYNPTENLMLAGSHAVITATKGIKLIVNPKH